VLPSYPSYAPILILGGVAFGFAAFTLVVSYLLGRPRPNRAKSAVYECGMPAIASASPSSSTSSA
jgi:NADH-quinone oxidoreductase subunit A